MCSAWISQGTVVENECRTIKVLHNPTRSPICSHAKQFLAVPFLFQMECYFEYNSWEAGGVLSVTEALLCSHLRFSYCTRVCISKFAVTQQENLLWYRHAPFCLAHCGCSVITNVSWTSMFQTNPNETRAHFNKNVNFLERQKKILSTGHPLLGTTRFGSLALCIFFYLPILYRIFILYFRFSFWIMTTWWSSQEPITTNHARSFICLLAFYCDKIYFWKK